MNCKNCSKEMTCNKEQCKFKAWKDTKNYGEVIRSGNTKDIYKR